MSDESQSTPFARIALSAFPRGANGLARTAAEELERWVDHSYSAKPFRHIEFPVSAVLIPYRIHFASLTDHAATDAVSIAAACLLTRSTNGFLRQRALNRVLSEQTSWVAPYVVLPLGEYVAELCIDILTNLPNFDRAVYTQFILRNRALIRLLRARATSYYDCYYRSEYLNREDYPALRAIRELEMWAA